MNLNIELSFVFYVVMLSDLRERRDTLCIIIKSILVNEQNSERY